MCPFAFFPYICPSCIQLSWIVAQSDDCFSGVGFTKGLKSKICLKSKIKVLNVKNFVIKWRQSLCLDKMGFIKGLRQNVVLISVLTFWPLQGRLKSFSKYSIACIYILPFAMPPKYTMGIYTSYKIIFYVDCNRNLHCSISYKFPRFISLWS